MTNPRHVASKQNKELVEILAAVGIPQDRIARLLKIDPKTLREYYRDELDLGSDKATAKVAGTLFKTATEGIGPAAITAQIFWLKTRAGWREPRDTDGNQIEIVVRQENGGVDSDATKHLTIKGPVSNGPADSQPTEIPRDPTVNLSKPKPI